ncbi:hypothetical protein ABOZ73_04285 [Caulobacter sp. 73W]|uniref:Calcium-binding protein n=1 Tax=Caulobacter sp. 73W TaxID=3161137 RepID=A0AB39KW46_9CAUL
MATITGTAGNDELAANTPTGNVYEGLAGDDYMRGSDGKDTYNGGDGFDRVSFGEPHAKQGVIADLRTQTVTNDGFGNAETMSSIEALGGGTFFADLYEGDDNINLFLVGLGDTARGRGGDDRFQIDDASALVDGGDGIDSITLFTLRRWVKAADGTVTYVTGGTKGVIVSLATGFIVDDGFGNTGRIANIENLGGSNRNDELIGDAKNNVLSGYDGDDYFRGGAGKDSFDGGAGFDRISFAEADATQGVIADLRTQAITNDGFGNAETMTSIEGLGGGTRFADLYEGDDNANFLVVGLGDTARGRGGDDTFQIDDAPTLIDGGDGIDTITAFSLTRWVEKSGGVVRETLTTPGAWGGVNIDLGRRGYIYDSWGNSGKVANIENVVGTKFKDVIFGSNGANTLVGGDGDDMLISMGGDDIIESGLGKDVVWSGGDDGLGEVAVSGSDTLRGTAAELNGDTFILDAGDKVEVAGATITSATLANQTLTINTSAGAVVLSTGGAVRSGTVTISGSTVTVTAVSNSWTPTAAELDAGFGKVVGVSPTSAKATSPTVTLADGRVVENTLHADAQQLTTLKNQYAAGNISSAELSQKVAAMASDTTAVAVQAYQFFTGATPKEAGIAYLVDSTENTNDLTDPYYATFNEANRYINFAVNLGKLGEGKDAFAAAYGALSFEAAIRKAYDVVIGTSVATANGVNIDAAVAYVAGRQSYFAAYGVDDIGTKAAMVGYLMQAGLEAKFGHYAKATTAFLIDAMDGTASYNVPLVGVYGLGSMSGAG